MFSLLLSILRRHRNIVTLLIGSLFLFSFFKILPQLHIVYDFWALESVSLMRKLEILYQYSYGNYSTWYFFETVITLLLSFLTLVNILIFAEYYKRQKKVLNKGSFFATTTGIFFGIFGVGCISCGAIILAPILSFLGILGSLSLLPFAGRELAVIGVVCILGSIFYLLYQLKKPLICS